MPKGSLLLAAKAQDTPATNSHNSIRPVLAGINNGAVADDCKDAGGRATQGAVAEANDKRFMASSP
jgi:hypothetical protein